MAEQALRTEHPTDHLLTPRFGLLLVAQASFGFAFSCFFLLPKFLASELGAGPSQIGLLTAVNGAGAVVFMFAMGVLVDRFGRRRFFTFGAVLMALASLGFADVHEMGPLIYGLRLLQGLAFSMVFVAGAAMAIDQAPPQRLGQAIGIFGLTMLSMNAIAPVLVAEIASRHGWPHAFAAASIGAIVSAGLSRLLDDGAHAPDRSVGLASLWRVARQPDQLRSAVVISAVGACFGNLFVFHQLYALELGIVQVQVFFVAYAAAAICARLGLGGLGDRLGRRRVASAMLVLYGTAAFGMTALAQIGLAPLGALFGLAHGLFYPAYNAMAVEGSAAGERGMRMALFQGWFNAGVAGGSFALGFVAEAYGYPTIFVLSGLFVVGALAVLRTAPRAR